MDSLALARRTYGLSLGCTAPNTRRAYAYQQLDFCHHNSGLLAIGVSRRTSATVITDLGRERRRSALLPGMACRLCHSSGLHSSANDGNGPGRDVRRGPIRLRAIPRIWWPLPGHATSTKQLRRRMPPQCCRQSMKRLRARWKVTSRPTP